MTTDPQRLDPKKSSHPPDSISVDPQCYFLHETSNDSSYEVGLTPNAGLLGHADCIENMNTMNQLNFHSLYIQHCQARSLKYTTERLRP